jgi:hypothetical protein
MASLLKWARNSMRPAPSLALSSPSGGFETIRASQIFEEERFEGFKKRQYYPDIGNVLGSQYQVVGKLSFGTTSTVWLARDPL